MMRLRDMWAWIQFRRRKVNLTTAYLILAGGVLLGFIRTEDVIDNVKHEADLRIATQCVASYERIEQIRDGDEAAYRGGAEAIIAVARDADPEDVQRYRQIIEDTVDEIRSVNPDPECDLEAAQRLLNDN